MKNLLIILVAFATSFTYSQTQGVAYTAVGKGSATTFLTDYHCIGINSSALGWGNRHEKKFTMGLTEFSLGFYSDSLSTDKLRSLYGAIRNEVTGSGNSPSTWAQQAEYGKQYAQAGIAIDASFNYFGFSFQAPKLGGIALNVQEQYQWYSKFGQQTSEILFEGKVASIFDSLTVVFGSDTTRIENRDGIANDTLEAVIAGTITSPLLISQITSGTSIKGRWDRNFNFGYGRKIFGRDSVFVVYAGIGGRFIQSVGYFDLESTSSGIVFSSAVSPSFDIAYDPNAQQAPSFAGTNQGGFPQRSSGTGYGIDLSTSVIIANRLKLALAVNNIGSVTYKRNVYTIKDTLLGTYSLDGLDGQNITSAQNLLLRQGSIIQLQGEQDFVVKNAATFRVGGSLDVARFLTVGFDVVAPFDRDNPGSIQNPIMSLGTEIRPIKWLELSAGYFGGGIYKNNIPVGINFVLGNGTYEFGLASRDMLSLFLSSSNSISTAVGVARFRF